MQREKRLKDNHHHSRTPAAAGAGASAGAGGFFDLLSLDSITEIPHGRDSESFIYSDLQSLDSRKQLGSLYSTSSMFPHNNNSTNMNLGGHSDRRYSLVNGAGAGASYGDHLTIPGLVINEYYNPVETSGAAGDAPNCNNGNTLISPHVKKNKESTPLLPKRSLLDPPAREATSHHQRNKSNVSRVIQQQQQKQPNKFIHQSLEDLLDENVLHDLQQFADKPHNSEH